MGIGHTVVRVGRRAAVLLSGCLLAGAAVADYEVSRIGGVIKSGDAVRILGCRPGHVIVGLRLKAGTYVDIVQLKCAAPTSRTTLGSAVEGPSTGGLINPAEVLVPGVHSTEKTVFCPQHYVLSGIKARGGRYVDRINSIRCTRFGGTSVRFRDVGIGGTGGSTVRAYCASAPGDVVGTFRVKTGFWMDALHTFCRLQ